MRFRGAVRGLDSHRSMPSQSLKFRPFDATDAPRLERWLRDAGMPLPDRLARHIWATRMAGGDPRIVAFAALAGRTPVGFVRLDLAPDRSGDVTLIVDPRQRRRGIGSALVEHALMVARSRGLSRLVAAVRPENEAALRLFGDAGFEPSGATVVGFVHLARFVHRGDRERPLEIVP